MAQFELIVFAADLELDRPDIARAAAPGNDFLNVRSTRFEIVIKERSWIDRQAFPAFADVFDCEIREFDFLAGLVFHTRPVRRLLFRCSLSAADWTNESQQAPEHEDKSRIISHEPEVFGVFWNIGSDLSMTIHGNLSSRKITFVGANGVGSSSDAIVTSIILESLLSSKNKCVPQHAAKQRIRFACAILRGSPFVTTKSSRGNDPGDVSSAGASPAIDAMRIDQRKRPTLQHVSCPAANAST